MLYNNEIVKNDMFEIINRKNIPFDKLNNKTVLITGANGMLAYYFTCVLMHLNIYNHYDINIIALVRNIEKAKEKFKDFYNDSRFKLLNQDICEPIMLNENINYILHAAGGASPYFIENDPVGIIKANTQGTINILEYVRKHPVENILYTSTREVYGKVSNVELIKEEDMGTIDPLDSRSCYPESKRMSEQLFKSYYNQYKIPYTIVRIAHSYGPGMIINNDGRVMADFISDVVKNKDIIIRSTGEAIRAFCYITDAVSAMFLAMLKGEVNTCYNIANETEPMMIRDIAKTLVKEFDYKNLKVVYDTSTDQSYYCNYKRIGLDTSKIELLGWKPEISICEGMRRTVLSYDNK